MAENSTSRPYFDPMKLLSDECTIPGIEEAGFQTMFSAEPASSRAMDHPQRAPLSTDDLLIRVAQAAAQVRPLTPYPGWRFDIDWDKPDPVFEIRRQIWSYFRDRKVEIRIEVPWHCGMRVHLWLSNDLSKQLFIAGCNEPNEMAFVDSFLKPSMVFLDAGAHEGLYTLLASARVGASGCVYSCEPSSREFERLTQNLSLNSISNVRALAVALTDADGEADLKVAENEHSGQNTLGIFAYQIDSAGCERVTMMRVDDLMAELGGERLDLMKLDVEGAELKLLHGAQRTLRKLRPVLLFEVSEPSLINMGSSAVELMSFLRSIDYEMYIFDPQSGMPVCAKPGELTANMLAAPVGVPIAS